MFINTCWGQILWASTLAGHRFHVHQSLLGTDIMCINTCLAQILCASMLAVDRFHGHQPLLGTDSMCINACCIQIPCASTPACHRFSVHQCLLGTDSMRFYLCLLSKEYFYREVCCPVIFCAKQEEIAASSKNFPTKKFSHFPRHSIHLPIPICCTDTHVFLQFFMALPRRLRPVLSWVLRLADRKARSNLSPEVRAPPICPANSPKHTTQYEHFLFMVAFSTHGWSTTRFNLVGWTTVILIHRFGGCLVVVDKPFVHQNRLSTCTGNSGSTVWPLGALAKISVGLNLWKSV